jgi:ABC-type anion transport system duplicated permease subunit
LYNTKPRLIWRVVTIVAVAALIWFTLGYLIALSYFIAEHGRFPVGSGEVVNWTLDLK